MPWSIRGWPDYSSQKLIITWTSEVRKLNEAPKGSKANGSGIHLGKTHMARKAKT